VVVGDGLSCFFWKDKWINPCPAQVFPELFSFAKTPTLTVNAVLTTDTMTDLFQLPLSEEALVQFNSLQETCDQNTSSEGKDRWCYTWGNDIFSSAKIYRSLIDCPPAHQAFHWIWKSPCQPKHKIFFWLILKDRLSTRGLLRRRNMVLDDYNCVLCDNREEESLLHLMIQCRFAKDCWGLIHVSIASSGCFVDITEDLKSQLRSSFFMVLVILTCWSIWVARNNCIFNSLQPSVTDVKETLLQELRLVKLRIKKEQQPIFSQWIRSFFSKFLMSSLWLLSFFLFFLFDVP